MKRSIDDELLSWKNEVCHKPLLLRGARQVGKTYAVRKLGRRFTHLAEINFDETPDAVALFNGDLSPRTLVPKLQAYVRTPITAGDTLLFLDEIQKCPAALGALRYFHEQMPDLHVIAAGSLLEFALEEIPSFGVGRVTSRFMYPMTFDEFAAAMGEEALLDLLQAAGEKSPLGQVFHRRLVELLQSYMVVGGLPEAVSAFARRRDYLEVERILDDLILTFEDDFAKYRRRVPLSRLRETFRSVAAQTGGKFKCVRVNAETKSTAILDALALLEKAGLVLRATHTSANGIPLGSETDVRAFKAFLFDSGIHLRLLGLNMTQFATLDGVDFVNKGALAELHMALAYAAADGLYHRPELYYWHREARSSSAEVDFVVQRGDRIVPIEVKAGNSGRMKSLRMFMAEKKSALGLRFSLEDFSRVDCVFIRPLYAAGRIYDGI